MAQVAAPLRIDPSRRAEGASRWRFASKFLTDAMHDRRIEGVVRGARWLFTAVRRTLGSIWGWLPITPFGAAAFITVWYFGLRQSDLIISAVCAAGMGCLLLNSAQVLLTGIGLRLARVPKTSELLDLEAQTAGHTEFHLGLFGWNPIVRCAVRWEEPEGVEVVTFAARSGFQEQVLSKERCSSRRIVRVISVSDLFGLSRIWFRRAAHRPVRCLPWTGPPPSFALVEQFRPGDLMGHPEGEPVGDLVEMRRYAAGDPLKLVLWKAYARTGRLLVRTPERSVSPTDRTLVHLVAGQGDEPSAGIVRGALERGLLGPEAVFLGDGSLEPASSLAECLEQIVGSKQFRDRGGARLDEFLVQGESRGISAAWLFVPFRPGPWLERVATALERHYGPFSIVIGIDGPPRAERPSVWSRWAQPEGDGQSSLLDDLRLISNRLIEAGATVRVVDRLTGEEVPAD